MPRTPETEFDLVRLADETLVVLGAATGCCHPTAPLDPTALLFDGLDDLNEDEKYRLAGCFSLLTGLLERLWHDTGQEPLKVLQEMAVYLNLRREQVAAAERFKKFVSENHPHYRGRVKPPFGPSGHPSNANKPEDPPEMPPPGLEPA